MEHEETLIFPSGALSAGSSAAILFHKEWDFVDFWIDFNLSDRKPVWYQAIQVFKLKEPQTWLFLPYLHTQIHVCFLVLTVGCIEGLGVGLALKLDSGSVNDIFGAISSSAVDLQYAKL